MERTSKYFLILVSITWLGLPGSPVTGMNFALPDYYDRNDSVSWFSKFDTKARSEGQTGVLRADWGDVTKGAGPILMYHTLLKAFLLLSYQDLVSPSLTSRTNNWPEEGEDDSLPSPTTGCEWSVVDVKQDYSLFFYQARYLYSSLLVFLLVTKCGWTKSVHVWYQPSSIA